MSTSEATETMSIQASMPSELETLLGGLDTVSDQELQQAMAAVVRAFAARAADRDLDAFTAHDAVTATEVMIAATAMLRTAELQLFELGMWQAWSGRH